MRLTAVTNHQIARMMINAETNNIDTVNSDIDCGEVNRGLGSSGRDIIERITPQTPGKKIYLLKFTFEKVENIPVEVTQ